MALDVYPPHRFSHSSMGTVFEAVLNEKDSAYAGQVSQAVFEEIDRLERLFTRFNPCSEIGQVNALQPGQAVRVSVDVFECLTTAFRVQDQTQGAFSMNIETLAKQPFIQKPVTLTQTKQGFSVRRGGGRLEPSASGLDLDLGGIGKGFALDRARDILLDWSMDNALIHGGTSTVLAVGNAPGLDKGEKGWPVGVGGSWPVLEGKKLFLKDRALSGSGTEVKGKHIIDPRTGQEASGHMAAWVSHPSAAVADALSTAFMVMDTHEVKKFCAAHLKVWALVLIDPGRYEVYNDALMKE